MFRDGGIPYKYEPAQFTYVVPESVHTYTPDFSIKNIYLETKGKFTPDDRKKMLHVMKSNQDKLLIMVFPQPNNRLRKGSKTTYSVWCEKNGIPWLSVADLQEILAKEDYYDHLQQRAQRVELQGVRRRRKSRTDGVG